MQLATPAAIDRERVGGDVAAHQREDHHDDMLGNADAVGDLRDGDAVPDGGMEIDMVGADAGHDRKLQLLALAILSAVRYAGQKGCEMTISALGNSRSKAEFSPCLVRGYEENMTQAFQELARCQATRDRPEQLTRLEVDLAGCGRRLSPG